MSVIQSTARAGLRVLRGLFPPKASSDDLFDTRLGRISDNWVAFEMERLAALRQREIHARVSWRCAGFSDFTWWPRPVSASWPRKGANE